MKRILKTWILTMMFCLGSIALFSQSAAACSNCGYKGYSHGHVYNYGYRHGYKYYGYHHGYKYGYRHYGYGYNYGKRGYSCKTFTCKSYSYDPCSCGCSTVVTTYKTYVVPCRACTYDNCCCPRWYTYNKRYTYAVKTVKYYNPVRYNSCNSCCN